MINCSKNIKKELNKIKWLCFTQIMKETIAVLLATIFFTLFLSGVNLLLQQFFVQLL
ncbi:preprotein translocase subunit SecE [Lactococcus lactis subsp. lactis]|nr:preprotein translocase subunit SecE [Lactococcus lactis subsp. lactis]ATZ02460.1 preprotein translocase subunit SecE [Lactococcus lactis subsp. lactis]